MKKVSETLKSQLNFVVKTCQKNCQTSRLDFEKDIGDLEIILKYLEGGKIKFKSNDGCNENNTTNPLSSEGIQAELSKERGRKTKTSTMLAEPKVRSDSQSSDSKSLNDSSTSTSSSRSRRAAAQAAEQKLAQVQSLVHLKTKLRRPTNFDEKQVKTVSSPPAKCRRTHRNQSAGSSSSQSEDVFDRVDQESCKDEMNVDTTEKVVNAQCSVVIEKLNTPTIRDLTHPKTRSSRSLDRLSKRISGDLFNDSIPLAELICKNKAPNSDPTYRNKSTSKKDLDSGISCNEEEHHAKAHLPIAQSSPISLEPTGGEFKGFDDNHTNAGLMRENTFVIGTSTEETHVMSKKTVKKENQEISNEETEQIDAVVIKSKTKVLRKKETPATNNVEEKENVIKNNETHTILSNPDDSPKLRSRTKVLKKATDPIQSEDVDLEKEPESSPEMNTRSRTKTIKKHNVQQELKSNSEEVVKSIHSNTVKKCNNDDHSDSTDNESTNARSRTKTIRKGTTDIENIGLEAKYLTSEFKDNLPLGRGDKHLPSSPAPAKGELVKKRVEDFEKMQNGTEEFEEEKTVGRVTRNAIKSKTTASAIEDQNSKQAQKIMQSPAPCKMNMRKSVSKGKRNKLKEDKENIAMGKTQTTNVKPPISSERQRMTPLGVNNRMTPAPDSAHKSQANKWVSSASRPLPVETTNVALIHKQTADEMEKKRKEEERLKRQLKEEEAKKKKEKVLKATAEEARRKRLEKLQKIAATREAAEKEKERLAAKAEKEKEEKMKKIALEKGKQKEEQLKKKHLMQQKTLEHEERRKQEEAARMAKIKEQEEEHRRLHAMKERELELQKQKAELKLAEAEKIKHQGGKLGKIAALNNAKLKLQHGMTPAEKTNKSHSSNCYEITPAREDRPLLPPKTENDYGIDDALSGDSSDDESQPKKMIPLWAQSKNREQALMINRYIPKELWDMFMECDPNPDINKIFAGNPIKRRIRTSSAVWRTPPKYSRVAPE